MTSTTAAPQRTMLPPPAPGSTPQLRPAPTANASGAASAAWVLYESTRRGQRLQLTEQQMSYGKQLVAATGISDVAFWAPRAGEHLVHVDGIGPSMTFKFVGRGRRDQADALAEHIAAVRWLEQRVFPRLVQARLQRLALGLTVRVGRLDIREGGLRWRGLARRRHASWNQFAHVVVTRQHVAVVVRSATSGRLTTLARLPHNELNAVLLPSLLPVAARTFASTDS